MRVDELRVVRRGFRLDIAILEGDDDVKADVILLMALPLGQLELLDIVHHLLRSNKLGQLQDLINRIISHQERSLFENLNNGSCTIPARIIPTDQQSTR
jgi:hypothetical protein